MAPSSSSIGSSQPNCKRPKTLIIGMPERCASIKLSPWCLEDRTPGKCFKPENWIGWRAPFEPSRDAQTLSEENNQLKIIRQPESLLLFNTQKPLRQSQTAKSFELEPEPQRHCRTKSLKGISRTGFVPLSFGLETIPYFDNQNIETAKVPLQ